MSDELYQYYQSPDAYEVYSDFLHFAKRTEYRKDIKWAVISNMDVRLHTIFQQLELVQYFDLIMTSEEAKCSKPERGIFEQTIKKLRLDSISPNEILHIGDDYKKDCPPEGWHRILIQRDASKTYDKFKHICYSFHEVSKIISKDNP